MGSNNSKVQDIVFILKKIQEYVRYLDVFYYKVRILFISTSNKETSI